MKLKLHHINLSTNNVTGMDHFYRNVLGLKAETDGLPILEKEGVLWRRCLCFRRSHPDSFGTEGFKR